MDWPDELRSIFDGEVTIEETIYASGAAALHAVRDATECEFPAVEEVDGE